jgi:hypothetical protein
VRLFALRLLGAQDVVWEIERWGSGSVLRGPKGLLECLRWRVVRRKDLTNWIYNAEECCEGNGSNS